METFSSVCLLTLVCFAAAAGRLNAAVTFQTITLERSLQIPGTRLSDGFCTSKMEGDDDV
jgi:hypothetical protein